MGFDQTTNIILADSIERIFSPDEPVIEEPLGVEIVRGDNIVSFPAFARWCSASLWRKVADNPPTESRL